LRNLHHEQKCKDPKGGTPAQKILNVGKEDVPIIDFTHNENILSIADKYKMVKFQMNPTPNWGPQSRPGKEKKDTKAKSHNLKRVENRKRDRDNEDELVI
jgi:hypothetical protein